MEITQTQTIAWGNPPVVDGMAPSMVRRAPMPPMPCDRAAPSSVSGTQSTAEGKAVPAQQSRGAGIMAIFSAIVGGLQHVLAHIGWPPTLTAVPPQPPPLASAGANLRTPE